MRTLILLVTCACTAASFAQQDSLSAQPIDLQHVESNDGSFTQVDAPPSYPGGEQALLAYLNENLRYPDAMRQAHVTGTVHLAFTITDRGEVKDARVRRGIDGGEPLHAEALRVVNAMPNWQPARVQGVAVPMEYVLPITFGVGDHRQR